MGSPENTHPPAETDSPLTSPEPHRRRPRGLRELLHDRSGVVDLGSIVVGVVVTAIMSLGAAAVVFGVIPWSQDNAAQQTMSAVSNAQDVAANKSGRFLTGDGLVSGGYLQKVSGFSTGTNGQGSCFVTVSTSDSGKVYYSTNKNSAPATLTAGTKSSCLTGLQLQGLVDSTGGKVTITPETYYAYGWGANDLGQAGTGSTTALTYTTPAAIPITAIGSGVSVTAVSAGANHSCAATSASKIFCWGEGTYNKLGQVDFTNYLTPIQVRDTLLTGKTLSSLTSGTNHNCVVAAAQAYCWGANNFGQFGNGNTTNSGVTVLVSAFAGKTVTGISAGHASTCAVVNAEAYCWGENSAGRIGDGTTTNSLVPVKVGGLLAGKKVSEAAAGRNHSCAIANGDVYCWGTNASGQLGNGNTTASLVPVKVTGLPVGKAASGLTAGSVHNCVTVEGTVYCWGGNSDGQLGNGTNADSSRAVAVAGLLRGKTVTMVSASLDNTSAGDSHTCALANDAVYCWGYNADGELGNYSTTNYNVPVVTKSMSRKMTAIAAGGVHNVSIGVPIVP
jgi:alpha-tubulin suppressor-like RCC1 family protein